MNRTERLKEKVIKEHHISKVSMELCDMILEDLEWE